MFQNVTSPWSSVDRVRESGGAAGTVQPPVSGRPLCNPNLDVNLVNFITLSLLNLQEKKRGADNIVAGGKGVLLM